MKKTAKAYRFSMIAAIVFLIGLLTWLYHFPIYRIFAENKYDIYSLEQGAFVSDIETKKVFKDYKQGGYFISVTYKSDPNHRYQYQYFLVNHRRNQAFNVMYCSVYDNHNNELEDFSDCIYKPLE